MARWLLSVPLALLAFAHGWLPGGEPQLVLKGAPGHAVDGAFPNDTGGVFAITFVNGARRVVYQGGGSSAPNPIFQEGASGTGGFEAELPLKPLLGTEYAIVGSGGTTPANTLVVLTPAGVMHYRLSPSNYPSLVNPTLLDSWGVGVRIPTGHKEHAVETRYILNALFREGNPGERRTTYAVHFGKTLPGIPVPLKYEPPYGESMENLSWRSYRNYAVIQKEPGTPGYPGTTLLDTGPGGYDGFAGTDMYDGAVRPFGLGFDSVPGEPYSPQGTVMPPRVLINTPFVGSWSGGLAEAKRVQQTVPGGDTMALVLDKPEGGGGPAFFAAPAPVALAEAKKSPEPAIDCSRLDINGDGKVDHEDLNLLYELAAAQGRKNIPGRKGDLTGDGRIGSDDMALFLRQAPACEGWTAPEKSVPADPTRKFEGGLIGRVLGPGQSLPGMPNVIMTGGLELRGNALGTNAMLVSTVPLLGGPAGKAVLLLDADGFGPVLRTGENLGHGVITDIGDTTIRRGLSPINRHGQFAVTVSFQDGSQGVYLLQGRNIDFTPLKASTMAVVNPLLGIIPSATENDLNLDGAVDAADVLASM